MLFEIDIIGECGKGAENRPDFQSSNYSSWLLDVFEALQIKNAIVVGCSLGGWIATNFTIRHPEKVNQLVLIATAGITQIKFSIVFLLMITSVSKKWGFRKINEKIYGDVKLDEQTTQFTKLVKQHFIPRTDVLPVFSDTELKKIKKPVFFVGGEND